MVQAAILSAHGNSGAILAEMLISVCRRAGPERVRRDAPGRAGRGTAAGGGRGGRPGRRPTGRRDDPDRGRGCGRRGRGRAGRRRPDDALAVAEAAQRAAADEALARTPEQLEVLAAGGRGGRRRSGVRAAARRAGRGPRRRAGTAADAARPPAASAGRRSGDRAATAEYEVMYALRGAADPTRWTALREELSALGHSVVVVGDQSVAQVHVHLSGGRRGRGGRRWARRGSARSGSRRCRRSDAGSTSSGPCCRVVAGPGLAEAVDALGGTRCWPPTGTTTLEELTAAADARLRRRGHPAERHGEPRAGQPPGGGLRGPGSAGGGHPDRRPGAGAGRDGRARADAPTSTRPWWR